MTDEDEVPEGSAVLPLIPAELGVDPVVLALLHTVVFLEGSSDKLVHPAAAGEVLEYVAGYLQRLSGARLERIREDLRTLADFARQEKWPREAVRFLKEFLGSYGVGEGE